MLHLIERMESKNITYIKLIETFDSTSAHLYLQGIKNIFKKSNISHIILPQTYNLHETYIK